MTDDVPSSQPVDAPEPVPMDQPLSSQQSRQRPDLAQPPAHALAPAEIRRPVVTNSSRLTLTSEQLCELTTVRLNDPHQAGDQAMVRPAG